MELKYDRTKKPIAFEQEKIKKAKHIFSDFIDFTDGVRTLFLIQRHKEGGATHNTRLKKYITRNSQEWYEALEKLIDLQMEQPEPLRIYACVNSRNFNKAIRQFKYEQLGADYYDQVQKENFYLEIHNRFIGCLMQPAQRASSLFLFDCDDLEGVDVHGQLLQVLPNELIVKQYRTKNGWHVITEPFNHTKIVLPENCEMKKDGLLLVSY